MQGATTDFDARNMTIRELLFSGNSCFKIPEYQRPYTWTTDEAGDFWNDLTEYKGGIPYYFGSFIFNENGGNNQIEIVDGQQRTLTISLLIMVIRDIFDARGAKEYATELQSKYVREHSLTSVNKVSNYIIEPGYSTKEYFRRIQDRNADLIHEKTPTKKEEKDIYKVYNYFYEQITKVLESEENDISYLINLLDKLLSSSCIRIVVNDENVAFTIFETVNARGAALSAGDLVKNLFFRFFHDNSDQKNAKELRDILDANINQSGSDISTFLRNYWKAKHGYITTNDLFKMIKQEINSMNYEKTLKEIVTCSDFYKSITKAKNNYLTESENIFVRYQTPYQSGDLKKLQEIQNILQGINFLGVKLFAPAFISIFANYKTLVINDSVPLNLISNIEKFCYCFYKICDGVGRDIESEICKFAIKNRGICNKNGSNIKEELDENNSNFLNFLKEKMPKFGEFSEKFKELSYDKPNIVKYSLKRISNEKELKESNDDLFDYSKVSIEHLLPQNPTERGLTVDDVKEYVDSIGNLTIVGKGMNSHLSNKPLKEKIESEGGLSTCKLAITKELVNQIVDNNYEWNKETIENRTNTLCEKLFDMNKLC